MRGPFQLPTALQELVDDGIWPLNDHACQQQHLRSLLSREVVQTFASDEETICFYPYPFHTVSEAKLSNPYWSDERSALEEIDPDLSLILGDFGMGSDTAIILDYRSSVPRLLRLQWGEKTNHWIDCGISVDDLAERIRTYSLCGASFPHTPASSSG